ncbi:MAG: DUF1570 domain-containing protein [Planctomycetia bacterium]|nr:DUF1570 domain-containing protein [Planctomycetia bacterium]
MNALFGTERIRFFRRLAFLCLIFCAGLSGPLSGSLSGEEYARAGKPLFSDLLPYTQACGCVLCESDFLLEDDQRLQKDLIELQEDLDAYLNVPLPEETVILCLFSSWKSYNDFLKKKYPEAPRDRPALYIKDNGPGVLMVIKDEQMYLNVRHEMTHAILNASLRNVPIWLDEGLAKYFETPRGKRGYENPFLGQVKKGVNSWFMKVPSLARLEKLQWINQMGIREYRESWGWIHFMIHHSEETQRLLAGYLMELRPEKQRGISPDQAAELQKGTPLTEILKEHFPNYKQEYIDHFKAWDNRSAEPKRSFDYLSIFRSK